MFYKQTEQGWLVGEEVWLHGGRLHLSKDNKLQLEGWIWSEEPPRDYLEWIKKQLEDDNTRDLR